MPKRIALFILGLVMAISAFLLYQHFSGATMSGPTRPLSGPQEPVKPEPMVYESRDENGALEYLITAKSAEQMKDGSGKALSGQLLLHEPVATFYEKSGRILEINADQCIVMVDQTVKPGGGGSAGPLGPGGLNMNGGARGDKSATKLLTAVRLGRLSGHVRLLMTAKPAVEGEPPATGFAEAMKGELKIFFADDLTYDRDKSLLTSPGNVYVRADAAAANGTGLALAISSAGKDDSRHIEYLRLEKGDAIIIHHGGKALSGADLGLSTVAGAAGAGRAATAPAVVAPGTAPAATLVAQTKPAAQAIVYRLTFAEEVMASAGKLNGGNSTTTLKGDQLNVIFALSQELTNKTKATTTPATNAGANVATGPAASVAGTLPTTGTAPAVDAADPGPLPAVMDDDLVVRWHGPLEMRPASDEDLKLVGGKLADAQDVALEALGAGDRPVEVLDPSKYRVLAGRLFYHRAEDRVSLDPLAFKRVELYDLSETAGAEPRVTVICPGVNFVGVQGAVGSGTGGNADRHAVLLGPGTLVVKNVARAGATTKPAESGPTNLAWTDLLDVQLASVPDPKNPGKTTLSIRHAVLHGAAFHNDAIEFTSDQLDALIAASADAKQPAVLEHLLATGHVVANSLRRGGAAIAAGGPMDGLRGDKMEVLTKKDESGVLSPAQMILDGHATGWRYIAKDSLTPNAPAAGALEKELVTTNHLVVDLRAKAKGAPVDDAFTAMGQSEVDHFLATGDARVEIVPQDKSKQIVAESDELDVALNGTLGLGGAIATLSSSAQSLRPALVTVGVDDSIQGHKIVLRRKLDAAGKPVEENFAVAEAGQFAFLLPPSKENAHPAPMQVNWETSMTFDNRTKTATFNGKPVAQFADDKSGLGKLACEKTLLVQLKEIASTQSARAAGAGGADLAGAGNVDLDFIVADGNVDARGGQLGPDGKFLTDLAISTDHLKYVNSTHTFETVAGSLVINDHRPPPVDKPNQQGASTSGMSAFTWKGSLVYAGDANTITFTKDVTYIFKPTKPFRLSPGGGAGAREIDTARLDAPKQLVATLTKTTETGKTAASPIGLGGGGNQELSKVVADGWPTLRFGDFILQGETIQFDAPTHIASAEGQGESRASLVIPGETITMARKIQWDTTKDRMDIKLDGVVGSGILKGN